MSRGNNAKYCGSCKPKAQYSPKPKRKRMSHEETLLKHRQWREKNLERERLKNKLWRLQNPEKERIRHEKRRARRQAAEGSFTVDQVRKLAEAQDNRCYYCGKLFFQSFRFQDWRHIDHKIPLAQNGSNNIDNIVLACAECNTKKHAKTHEEFVTVMRRQHCV